MRAGKGFRYVSARGVAIRDPAVLGRIKRLAIPPAWTDVWISPDARGHLQATGRDARRRKQYRYHPDFRAARDGNKYERITAFARALPRIRARVRRDLARKGLPREKVLAAMVRLLDQTYMRVGNEEYRRANGSHGLTTLQDRHAKFRRGEVTFQFRGKAGKLRRITLRDARLARIVKRCQDLPGQDLFQYVDEGGEVHAVGSSDVNAYIREAAADDFTAKDFRTWAGTVLAARALRELSILEPPTPAKRAIATAVERAAEELGNTPAICRKCYVHPDVLDAYLDGTFQAFVAREAARKARARGLKGEEALALALLRRSLK